ncbi:MAG: plasmid pRiA4b ORF-3 family protein [bacterium]|nr:plasmid pRiA4b ORF-3 family protein [bacterium]
MPSACTARDECTTSASAERTNTPQSSCGSTTSTSELWRPTPESPTAVWRRYDFGDGWCHTIELDAIDAVDPAINYPRCTAGRRACPPDDCGGPSGFSDLIDAIADPTHPRHGELTEWLLPGHNPAHLDPDEATADIQAPRPLTDDWL